MDKRYEVYALADAHFYETPDRLAGAGEAAPLYATARRAVPEGWEATRVGDWLTLSPLGPDGTPAAGPAQGWKIHASATRANAEEIAAAVWDYCVPRRIPFKFVPGPHLLHLRNTKYAARDSSGKFVTVYPADEEQLHTVLSELGALLKGFEGPYILTDLRWGDGPLYVRYGAFARRFVVDERGSLVPAVLDGDGRLVPDRRAPSFQVPEWVTLPAFLEPHLAARNTTTVGELPYRIEKALHFSNGGGVYAGTDLRDGRKVVLKEGRPHAGLASDGADAIARLEREKRALEAVSGTGVVPEVRDWFTLGDHRFLVMDFVEGRPLNAFFAERHPLLSPDPAPGAVAAYTTWAVRIHRAVERAVEKVHARGIVFNDLHVFNVMVAPDEESVFLIDFEAAARAEENGRQVVAHPGFFAPADRRGAEVDRYALACLRLALFLPVTTLFVVDRGKAAHLAEVIAEQFPDVPRDFLDEAVAEITRAPSERGGPVTGGAGTGARSTVPAVPAVPSVPASRVEPGDWPHSRDSMVKAILASATPERDDRLFPGDVAQFSDGGGLGLAHGAAGVLYALAATGADRYDEGELWLLDHTAPAPTGTPLGFYDGLAGVAHVLDLLGHRQRALDLVDGILRERWQNLSSDLHGGLAGLGLVLGHLAHMTGEPELRERAEEAADILVRRLAEPAAGAPRRRAGLLRGASGPALFLLRHYEATGERALLDAAASALRRDLECCVERENGALEVDEGWRTMPYLGDGSVGVGLVLDEYLAAAAGGPWTSPYDSEPPGGAARGGRSATGGAQSPAGADGPTTGGTRPPAADDGRTIPGDERTTAGGRPGHANTGTAAADDRPATPGALSATRADARAAADDRRATAVGGPGHGSTGPTSEGAGPAAGRGGPAARSAGPVIGGDGRVAGSGGPGAERAAGNGAHTADAFERARAGIVTAATSRFYAQPGLFQGRAGMILHLARTTAPGATRARLERQIDGLGWLAMSYQGQLAFPGHQMMRLSMDLATGTAGCLLALAAALDEGAGAHLPFLPPPHRRPH
ncbi:class III lanthionine synthetase LanKC [Streptomyces sp. NPDC052016]|uniref:class III lanthionine synthetase LanKC n=1 Tax=Streptomyces sp. NPDC052016 TaxID=3365680 RepID=UPI0037D0CD5F